MLILAILGQFQPMISAKTRRITGLFLVFDSEIAGLCHGFPWPDHFGRLCERLPHHEGVDIAKTWVFKRGGQFADRRKAQFVPQRIGTRV